MKFEMLIGPEDGRVLEFEKEKVRMGRFPDRETNDWFLSWDKWVSRGHTEVIRGEKDFKVRDRGSTHGTSVKGKSHLQNGEEAQLMPGDILIIGRLWVKFLG